MEGNPHPEWRMAEPQKSSFCLHSLSGGLEKKKSNNVSEESATCSETLVSYANLYYRWEKKSH